MPDILLLPIIADIFEATLDELFCVEVKPKAKSLPMEDTPLAVYDAVLEAMWAWNGENNADDVEKVKSHLFKDPQQHSGFVSMKRGGVYADKNLALTYIADGETSEKLLSNEKAADFLLTLANPNVRKIMKYQLENRGVSYTVSSVSAKCKMEEGDAKTALEKMVNYSLSSRQTVEMADGERIDIYSHWGDHKLKLLIYPILSLAESLSDFNENWYGFRS